LMVSTGRGGAGGGVSLLQADSPAAAKTSKTKTSKATRARIVNPEDPAAATTPCGRFRGDVVEYKVDNGHRVHDPEPYLNNRWTGQAVAAGLADR